MVASNINTIIDACPKYTEGTTVSLADELLNCVTYTSHYKAILEPCSVFISSLDSSNAEYPKVIPEDIDKYIADAASVRKIIGKLCDNLDLLVVSGIDQHVEGLGKAIDGNYKQVCTLVNIIEGGKPEYYETAVTATTT